MLLNNVEISHPTESFNYYLLPLIKEKCDKIIKPVLKYFRTPNIKTEIKINTNESENNCTKKDVIMLDSPVLSPRSSTYSNNLSRIQELSEFISYRPSKRVEEDKYNIDEISDIPQTREKSIFFFRRDDRHNRDMIQKINEDEDDEELKEFISAIKVIARVTGVELKRNDFESNQRLCPNLSDVQIISNKMKHYVKLQKRKRSGCDFDRYGSPIYRSKWDKKLNTRRNKVSKVMNEKKKE